jgi:hypothetical protein
VPVPGGPLAYEVIPGTTEPVLAIHGVSSQRRLWNWLHAEAPDLTLIAPDLRGRADSVAISGPFSLAQHVEDMIIFLDQLEMDSVHAASSGFDSVPTRAVERRRRQCAWLPVAARRSVSAAHRRDPPAPRLDHAGTIMTHRGAAAVAQMIKDAIREQAS